MSIRSLSGAHRGETGTFPVPLCPGAPELGELGGASSARLRRLRTLFSGAGFATKTTTHIDAWLLGHAAFVAPIASALYRCDVDPHRLAIDRRALELFVGATREAFRTLLADRLIQIPTNLRLLCLWAPKAFAVD